VHSKEELRDRVIRIIAATGGRRVRGIMGPGGPVYPGIVITRANTDIQEVGEVETEDTVTEARVPEWRLMSEAAGVGRRTRKFFLYVPEGLEGDAERLLEENGVEYAGLRTWAVRDGGLVVTPVKTPDDPKDHR
jgi:hypothetical protein